MVSRIGVKLKKAAILTHRWMGVAFCLLFAFWFVSGIVMMYWDYPSVGAAERLAHAAALDPSKIRVSPAEAFASLEAGQAPTDARLTTLDGRPVYRFRVRRAQYMVYADDGKQVDLITPELTLRVASTWTGQPASRATFGGSLEEDDQWTLSAGLRNLRPLSKYSWANGEEVYVSEATGEVAQHTTPGSRMAAYFGAIPHWMYLVPLRKDGELWTSVIVWSSGIGTVMSLFGIVVGLLVYSPSKRYRFPDGRRSVPYSGQKRWHTILGLIFGLVTCTWVFSGFLSMEIFDWQAGRRNPRIAAALRGGELNLAAYQAKPPAQAIAEASSSLKIKELEFTSFAGAPVYLANESPQRSMVVPLDGAPAPEFDRTRILDLIARASRPYEVAQVRTVTEYESYYLDRHHELPLPVLFVQLNDDSKSMYYVDPRRARVVQSYSGTSRWNRWLYHGLHSMDFPWLYKYRPAWDITVLLLMLGGTSLCVTSLVIGWRRLKRKVSGRSRVRIPRTKTLVPTASE